MPQHQHFLPGISEPVCLINKLFKSVTGYMYLEHLALKSPSFGSCEYQIRVR